MSTMNLVEWPVESLDDFDAVVFDVTRFPAEDGESEWIYCVLMNFVADVSEDGSKGFTLITGIVERDLSTIKRRIESLMDSGLLADVEVSGHGTVWDPDHEEVGEVCWNSLGDGVEDEEDDVVSTQHTVTSHTLH